MKSEYILACATLPTNQDRKDRMLKGLLGDTKRIIGATWAPDSYWPVGEGKM